MMNQNQALNPLATQIVSYSYAYITCKKLWVSLHFDTGCRYQNDFQKANI